ncbi:hypothetical protein GCM10023082_09170 [Streptomyces tremellae]|uniref:Uncharacterized protein n=1 Tax=Streptomyces tremellae TaxID=1124239 RepID=A0ABP7E588_9ACTN
MPIRPRIGGTAAGKAAEAADTGMAVAMPGNPEKAFAVADMRLPAVLGWWCGGALVAHGRAGGAGRRPPRGRVVRDQTEGRTALQTRSRSMWRREVSRGSARTAAAAAARPVRVPESLMPTRLFAGSCHESLSAHGGRQEVFHQMA